MKSASPALIAFLNSAQQYFRADCYTLTLKSGGVYRYTTWPQDLVLAGNTFVANALLFNRVKIKSSIGLEVVKLDLDIAAGSNDLIGSKPFISACMSGDLDGAQLRLDVAIMQTAGDTSSLDGILQFRGSIADINVDRLVARMQVKSEIERLDVQVPRLIYQPGCRHSLYDARCKLVPATFQVNNAVIVGSTRSVILNTLAQAAGYFDLGKVTFTSGVLNGLTRTVRSYSPGTLTLGYPLPTVPVTGVTFTVLPGCDKLQGTCSGKFNNLPNFGGFPYVPTPESAV